MCGEAQLSGKHRNSETKPTGDVLGEPSVLIFQPLASDPFVVFQPERHIVSSWSSTICDNGSLHKLSVGDSRKSQLSGNMARVG
eukprot:CAMPEP_0204112956 /NCGR_PEP_ID=MMETSP0361-20130328/3369_1 /ASSEMBLY_ACC=CAM_ASM_000343 /TAXON_ID=268821 /ORGANISM="Scrippsiella Hangoei, Strain SHTV-5" /LENGTH=83 /DNA_ID=CAMNT_0051063241 /DNA_START=43 /DNA_END=294 /DNA_ORIENTATION=+